MEKRALITGVTGQDGSYLAEFLLDQGYEVCGMVRRSSTLNFERIAHIQDRITLVAGDLLDEEVAELAAVLASKPPGVMRLGRESFYAVVDSAAAEALPYLHAMLTVTSQTAEAAEGIAAFAEKRPPAWRAEMGERAD